MRLFILSLSILFSLDNWSYSSGRTTHKLPTSVSVKTSSYSVPAKKYARIVPGCKTSDLTVNGNTIWEKACFSGNVNNTAFATETNRPLKIHMYCSTGTLSNCRYNNHPASSLYYISFPERGVFIENPVWMQAVGAVIYYEGCYQDALASLPKEIMLNEGDTIACDRFLVEEYSK